MKTESEEAPEQGSRVTFNARLTADMKSHLQRAAEMRGQSLTDFVLVAAYERATATIEADRMIRLSQRDAEVFAAALERPPVVDSAVVSRFVTAHDKVGAKRGAVASS